MCTSSPRFASSICWGVRISLCQPVEPTAGGPASSMVAASWAAAGFKDTFLKWKMKLEVADGHEMEFSREFKLEAVKLVTERGVTVALAGALDGISTACLRGNKARCLTRHGFAASVEAYEWGCHSGGDQRKHHQHRVDSKRQNVQLKSNGQHD